MSSHPIWRFFSIFKRKDKRNIIANKKRDSTQSSNTPSSKQISSSGQSFQMKDGRRYHAADISYVFPSDDDEADRVHQQHWILKYALQTNYHAPVADILEKGIMVLDSGCGPATWLFEMGDTYPNSKFIGIDASLVFPENIKPPNVEFVIGNLGKRIPFPDNTFDYIHQRILLMGLTSDDWENALNEFYRILKPGGYLELNEPDLQDLYNMGPLMKKLQYTMSDMLIARNMPPKIAVQLKERITKAGFVHQHLDMKLLTLNHTDKAGELLWQDYRHSYVNLKPVMTENRPEWEDTTVYHQFLNDCGLESQSLKTLVPYYNYYAQKPTEKEEAGY